MSTWSGIRKKIENEYLAESLRGHIQYYVTTYSKSPDHNGRASIRYDGKEIIKGSYWINNQKIDSFLESKKSEKDPNVRKPFVDYIPYVSEVDTVDDTAIKLGIFDQTSFYQAFSIFDNQSIEDSLKSDNLIIKIFAILDRRVGKRRLIDIQKESDIFKEFYYIRAMAEKII